MDSIPTTTARFLSECGARCGRLIHPGDEMLMIGRVHLHRACLEAYEQQLTKAAKAAKSAARAVDREQNARPRPVELAEHTCANCGQRYAGRPETVVSTCRAKAHTLPAGVKPLDGERCGGKLLDGEGDEWPPGPIAPWDELPAHLRKAWSSYWLTPGPDGALPVRPTRERIRRGE